MYVLFDPVDDVIGKVRAYIPAPYPEQIEEHGVYVDSIPKAEQREGERAVLYIRLPELSMYYEYIPVEMRTNE